MIFPKITLQTMGFYYSFDSMLSVDEVNMYACVLLCNILIPRAVLWLDPGVRYYVLSIAK